LRNSRLALLAMLSNQFLKIADISKLQSWPSVTLSWIGTA
jgi:hypothetical protein